MKKLIVTCCMAGIIALLSSCKTSGGISNQGARIDGEWTVTEINGSPVKTTGNGETAFIGFDTGDKRVNGFAGCNRIFGNIDIDTDMKIISFAKMASTRMMCLDMAVEDSLLAALGQVDSYDVAGKTTLVLKNTAGKTVVKLKKRNSK